MRAIEHCGEKAGEQPDEGALGRIFCSAGALVAQQNLVTPCALHDQSCLRAAHNKVDPTPPRREGVATGNHPSLQPNMAILAPIYFVASMDGSDILCSINHDAEAVTHVHAWVSLKYARQNACHRQALRACCGCASMFAQARLEADMQV